MRTALRAAADATGLYRLFRYSRGYEWYARARGTGYARVLAADRAFYRALFAEFGVRSVFDVGANVGDKAQVFRELGAAVVCVEPDPATADTLRYRFAGGVAVERAAVGERPGTAVLHRKAHHGFNTLSEKWAGAAPDPEVVGSVEVPVTTLEALAATHGRPDYVKIDVEGFEREVVAGLAAPVRVLSVESNLPLFRAETDAVLARLTELAPGVRFNARPADGPAFVLKEWVDASGLAPLLDVTEPTTFDLFAASPV